MDTFDSIVCVGQTPWEGDFQKAIVQLMTGLSARHRVLYVDYQYTLKDWAFGDASRPQNPLTKKTFPNGNEVDVWTPPLMLPVNWLPPKPHDWLIRWNTRRLVKGLRRVMRRLNMERPLVVNGLNPVSGLTMLHQLNEWATLYYCFDEITVGDWMGRHGGRYETLYLQRVDAVVTTSEALRQSKSVVQPQTYCVKNGVNFDLFNQARQIAEALPPTRPVVGYLGTADDRIDIELVEHCVRTMPDVGFRFVGEVPEHRLKQRLSPYPNVEFIPPRQPAELPALLARMTAAMIPYVCNAHTYTIYPLKINEYLAAGLPVVSTPFALLDDFDGIIERAGSPVDFATALRRALANNDPERLAERIATAQGNSWEKRTEAFEAVIAQLQIAHPPRPAESTPA